MGRIVAAAARLAQVMACTVLGFWRLSIGK
jgi:hypothetical protein